MAKEGRTSLSLLAAAMGTGDRLLTAAKPQRFPFGLSPCVSLLVGIVLISPTSIWLPTQLIRVDATGISIRLDQ